MTFGDVICQLLSVGRRERFEHPYVERLQAMSTVRRIDGQEDLVAITVVNKGHGDVRSMPIEDK